MIRININQQKSNRLGHIVLIYLYRIHLFEIGASFDRKFCVVRTRRDIYLCSFKPKV